MTAVTPFQPCPRTDFRDGRPQRICREFRFATESVEATVYSLSVRHPETGLSRVFQIDHENVFWLGVSEGGDELVAGTGNVVERFARKWVYISLFGRALFIGSPLPDSHLRCSIDYYAAASGDRLLGVPIEARCPTGFGEGTLSTVASRPDGSSDDPMPVRRATL